MFSPWQWCGIFVVTCELSALSVGVPAFAPRIPCPGGAVVWPSHACPGECVGSGPRPSVVEDHVQLLWLLVALCDAPQCQL